MSDLTDNPLIVDTAAGGVLFTTKLKVKAIRWVSEGASAADTVVIHDGSANVKWESRAAAANHTEADLIEEWWDGLDVDTIESGTVYIYLS